MSQREKILLVQNNLFVGQDFAQLLAQHGNEPVGPFSDAWEAIVACEQLAPRAAILDANLSGGKIMRGASQ